MGHDLAALPPPHLPQQQAADRGRVGVIVLLVTLLVRAVAQLVAELVAASFVATTAIGAVVTLGATVAVVVAVRGGTRRRVAVLLVGFVLVAADGWVVLARMDGVTVGRLAWPVTAAWLLVPWWAASVIACGRAHARTYAPHPFGLAESWLRSFRLAVTAAVVLLLTGMLQLSRVTGFDERAVAMVLVVAAAATGLATFAWWHAVVSCVRTLRAYREPARPVAAHRPAFVLLFLLAAAQPVVLLAYRRPELLDALARA